MAVANARQFDVFRTLDGTTVVVVQSDLLDSMRTRVVAPLISAQALERSIPALNPTMVFDGSTVFVAAQLLATVGLDELAEPIGSLADEQDRIVRAIDALLSGF